MKPTRILTLVGWAVSAVTAGYLVPSIMVANGGQTPQAPLNLILTLPIIAALLVAFSVPMIRYRRGLAAAAKDSKLQRPKPINPFFAVRLLVLSKAIAIAGSIFSGWYLGVVWLQLTAPVITDAVLANILALIGALLMAVCSVVVERMCRINDGGQSGGPVDLGKRQGSTEANPA